MDIIRSPDAWLVFFPFTLLPLREASLAGYYKKRVYQAAGRYSWGLTALLPTDMIKTAHHVPCVVTGVEKREG